MSWLDTNFVRALAQAQRRHGVEQVDICEAGIELRLIVRSEASRATAATIAPHAALTAAQASEDDEGLVRSTRLGVVHLRHPLHDAAPPAVGAFFAKGDTVAYLQLRDVITALEAPYDGVLREWLVQDGDKVDFGRALFRLGVPGGSA